MTRRDLFRKALAAAAIPAAAVIVKALPKAKPRQWTTIDPSKIKPMRFDTPVLMTCVADYDWAKIPAGDIYRSTT